MDLRVFFWINTHHNYFLDLFFGGLSIAGECYILWWILGVVAWLTDRKKGRGVMVCMALALLAVFISVNLVLKPLFARLRPSGVLENVRLFEASWVVWLPIGGSSFPSGHCASAMAAAWILGSFYKRYFWPLLILVGMIAYSRVYLGLHYPTDCLAGLAMGLFCAVLVERLIGKRFGCY